MSDMGKWASFESFITPRIIKILFWIGVVAAVLGGLIMFIQGAANGMVGPAIMGLIWMVLGPIIVRVYCELLILGFRVYDVLVDIRAGRRGAAPPVAAPPPSAPQGPPM